MKRTLVALALLGLLFPPLAKAADVESAATQGLVADQGLFFALAKNNIPSMATLRDQGANPNATLASVGLRPKDIFDPTLDVFNQPLDTAGWPILTWAVYLNNEAATRLLLRSGARVNATDEYGATPLHWAAWAGRHTLAQQLLNNGANCRARDFKGRSPKDWAVMVSQTAMIRLLDSRSCRGGEGDEDGDGVPDSLDQCPGTPRGAQVDERGCWVIAYATFFDFNRAVIKRQFLPYIRQAAQVLVNSPDIKVALIGHTDAIGTEAFNYDLGLRRALAVQNELIRQGVSSNRLGILSQGETAPIATNQTAAGRAKNRRVEIHVAQPGALDGYTPGDPDISEPLVDE